ncbi:hypothetical protein GCM10022381_19380 [Leifsonia kafniensis]|uniref:DUF6916 domain-containing protein n=1 Tax=Leifsonia kafniensis TaxID=475957 RepID=A0ABP7KGK0_9MICO
MPDVSRRTAVALGLGTLGLTAVTIAANPGRVGASLSALAASFGPPAIPARSIFAGSVGQVFTAVSSAGSFPVTLASIGDLAPMTIADDEDRFNLLFESKDARFEQGIYKISRPGVPMTELFVSPVNAEAKVRTLQALVNRQA